MAFDCSEFTTLTLKFEEETNSGHQIFVKENVAKIGNKSKPAGRTLYALNIPPYANEHALKVAFSTAGKVEKVILKEKPSDKTEDDSLSPQDIKTFKVAYVIFDKPSALKKVLKASKLNPLNMDGKLLTGIEKWVDEYQNRIPDNEAIQKEIDEYMTTYDGVIEMEKSKNKEVVKDDDGWTVVTKESHNKFSQKESTIIRLEDKIQKDKKDRELKNFYTFQIREAKKNDIISLRRKYEQDKQKMEQIKRTKRFKPF